MKVLRLDLDSLAECESPSSAFDIGNFRRYLYIKPENKKAFLAEMAANYRKLISDLLEEKDKELL
jgi:hypothetical protein